MEQDKSIIQLERELTPQQKNFILALVSGESQTDAYRIAYPKANAERAAHKAHELIRKPHVRAYYEKMKAQTQKLQVLVSTWSRLRAEEELINILENCKSSLYASDRYGNTILNHNAVNGAINAIKELNKLHGYNSDTNINIINQQQSGLEYKSDNDLNAIAEELKSRGLDVNSIEFK